MIRLPFAPLEELAADHSELARQLRTSRRTILRWQAAGTVPFWQADRACAAIGVHPIEVWGDDFYQMEDQP